MEKTIKLCFHKMNVSVTLKEKQSKEIRNCEKEKIIIIGDYTGRFAGMDGKYILMKPVVIGNGAMLGFPLKKIKTYYEEI